MKRKYFLIFVLAVLMIGLLTGCGNETDETATQESLVEEENASDEPVADRNIDLTHYSSYLKKIWIVEGWNDGAAYPVSLVITQMEEGYIKGYFCVDEFILFYYRNLALWKDRTPEFTGTIYDGTAECEYDYKNGSVGTLSITFCENDRIEVRLDGNEEESYLLRPYNVSDEEFLGEPTTIEVELDSWGTVTLFYANCEWDYPWVVLLNEQGDILYFFDGYWIDSIEVLDINVEDINGDGLKEVEVVTYFPDFPDEYRFECYFCQMEEGVFYVDWQSVIERLADDEYKINIIVAHTSLVYDGFPKAPSVCQVGKNLLEVSISVGSPARYTFYIDKEDARESDTYFNPILVGDKYVAYMEEGKLIISDIFYTDQQEDLLYMTIVRDFTKTADPISAIVGIELIDSENIELTYLTGEDYTEVTEIIPITKDMDTEPTGITDSPRELNINNPYFYDKEEIFLQATAKYFAGHFSGGWVEETAYIDIDMIQAYENGCVYKFTVDMDIDDGNIFFDKSWLNHFFYVTEDKIYIVPSRINIPSEGLEFDFNEDIHSLTEMFDTDEKLVEWSTIVCQEDEMIEDEEWYYRSITKTGDQVTYYAYSLRASGDIHEVCYYTWQEGKGLVSCGYRYGPGEGYDISFYDIEEWIVVE